MYFYLIFFWTYLKNFYDKIKFNKYLYINYDCQNDNIKVTNVSLLYNILNYMNLRNSKVSNIVVKNFYNIDLNCKLIKVNSNDQILFEDQNFIKPIVPKGIISDIIIDVKNHRYNLNSLKQNLFKIDKNIPLIFCLFYYENICKIENVNLSLSYYGKENNKIFKINDIDKISDILNNT